MGRVSIFESFKKSIDENLYVRDDMYACKFKPMDDVYYFLG